VAKIYSLKPVQFFKGRSNVWVQTLHTIARNVVTAEIISNTSFDLVFLATFWPICPLSMPQS
jgi:hypothetical protein